MKLKLKALAAVAAMAVAGQASAALSDAFVQNGTLFLTVYDSVTFRSYTRDLGVSLNDFLPTGALTSGAGATVGPTAYNFAGTSVFTAFAATAATPSNLRWMITGVDAIEQDGTGDGSRFVSTYVSAPSLVNGGIRSLAANAVNFAGELVANSGVDFSGAPTDGAFNEGSITSSFSGSSFAAILANSGTPGTFGTGFGTQQFWFAATSNDGSGNDTGVVNGTRFGNATNFATFSLAADGSVTYSLAADQVAAVPIPAAAWLLGSGLLGLGNIARRRSKAAKAAA